MSQQPFGLTGMVRVCQPCFTQIHPTCIPVSGDHQSKLTLMSESLRNDGRVWVPKDAQDCAMNPNDISEDAQDYYLERKYPSFGNLAPRDISSRSAKEACDDGRGLAQEEKGFIWIFLTLFRVWAKIRFESDTGIFFKCTNASPGKTHTKDPSYISCDPLHHGWLMG